MRHTSLFVQTAAHLCLERITSTAQSEKLDKHQASEYLKEISLLNLVVTLYEGSALDNMCLVGDGEGEGVAKGALAPAASALATRFFPAEVAGDEVNEFFFCSW